MFFAFVVLLHSAKRANGIKCFAWLVVLGSVVVVCCIAGGSIPRMRKKEKRAKNNLPPFACAVPFIMQLCGDSVLLICFFDAVDYGQFWPFYYEFWCECFCYAFKTNLTVMLGSSDAFMTQHAADDFQTKSV